MKTALILATLLISVVASQSSEGPSSNSGVEQSDIPVASAQPAIAQVTPAPCSWQETLEPNEIRFPVNMDTHAAYAIYVFRADGNVALNVTGSFPYAAFLSFTTYSQNGLLFDALLDKDIAPDPGSVNPFQKGALVNAPNRSYRMMVLPYGKPAPQTINSISMPPLPFGSTPVLTTLVLRVYLPAPHRDRKGGVPLPVITAFSANDMKTPLPCPTVSQTPQPSASADANIPRFGNFNGVPQPPSPKLGKILFYRPPVSGVPFADGSSQLTADNCTGYLMATLDENKLSIIHFKKIPTFFNNTETDAKTTFSETQVRYLSLGSYGASVIPPPGSDLSGNIAGTELLTTANGGATFVVIPASFPSNTRETITRIAKTRNFNVLPMAKLGPEVKPFLIYRNKVAATGFEGSISKVPCYTGAPFGTAPADYAASSCNMGPYAPQGEECSVEDFLFGKCGL